MDNKRIENLIKIKQHHQTRIAEIDMIIEKINTNKINKIKQELE